MNDRENSPDAAPGSDEALVSVVVAALGDSKELRNCLEILGEQARALPPAVEIVLVLNSREEAVSKESASALSALCDVLEFEARPGKSHALNRAIDAARGEVIAFTDDDVRPAPGWLHRLTAPLLDLDRTLGLMGCGGRVVPELPGDTPAWYRHMARYRPTTLLGPSHDLGPNESRYGLHRKLGQAPVGANCAYRREVFATRRYAIELGPNFVTGTRGGEDTELGRRVLMEGAALRFVRDAVVVHPTDPRRLSLAFCEQRFVTHGVEKVRARRMLGRAVPRVGWVRAYRALCRLGLVGSTLIPGWSRERVVLKRAVLRGMIAELEGRSDQVLVPLGDRRHGKY